MKRSLIILTAAALLITGLPAQGADASAKPKLSKSKISMKAGKSAKLKVSGVKKVKWSTSKSKIVALTAKKSKSVKLVAKKKGNAVITAKYTASGKSRKLTCKVTVSGKVKEKNGTNVTKQPGNIQTPPAVTATDQPDMGTPTPVPTPLPSPSVVSESGKWAYIPVENDSLLKEYGQIFGNVGTCLTYSGMGGKKELQDKETMEFVRENYNSFTLENEMKPSYLMADAEANFFNPPFNKLMSVSEAESKGYVIPENYSETWVPSINYDRLDVILKVSAENGIRMRAHTLIWHSQTPTEFFRKNYSTNGEFVTPEVMDKRVIYFVTNVVKHVCESEYKDVVYTWDITNEYFHQLSDNSARNWSEVYDIVSGSNILSTKPSFVKLAFKSAYDVLTQYELQDKVPLFYNDYNTSQVADEIIEMINYINSADDINPEGKKLCAGVGMQSHLDLKWPTVEEQLATVQKFIDAGFEVQITELDVINNLNSSEEAQCDYWYDFMKGLVDKRKNGAKITGITFWGLSDSVSWRFGQKALLYGNGIKDPKKALYAVYAAAQSIWQ